MKKLSVLALSLVLYIGSRPVDAVCTSKTDGPNYIRDFHIYHIEKGHDEDGSKFVSWKIPPISYQEHGANRINNADVIVKEDGTVRGSISLVNESRHRAYRVKWNMGVRGFDDRFDTQIQLAWWRGELRPEQRNETSLRAYREVPNRVVALLDVKWEEFFRWLYEDEPFLQVTWESQAIDAERVWGVTDGDECVPVTD